MAEHSGARGTAANAVATANVGGVWGCFQGLASLVRTRSPELLGDQLQHLPAPEVFSTVLDFLPASALATLSISSSWCRRFADAEEVWRQACVKTWATKQHSARMRTAGGLVPSTRTWLSESARSSPTPGSSSSSSDSEDTWKARYIFALKDRHRCRILPEEQDSDSSHVDMHESEHSHSSVSSIPVLSTPMMEMDALSFRTLERGAGLGRRTRLVASEAAAAAAGLVDGRRRDLPRPRFLRTLRPPPPPLLHFGRRFADGPFLMPLPLPLAAVPLPTPPVVPRRRHASGCCLLEVPSLPFLLRVGPEFGSNLHHALRGKAYLSRVRAQARMEELQAESQFLEVEPSDELNGESQFCDGLRRDAGSGSGSTSQTEQPDWSILDEFEQDWTQTLEAKTGELETGENPAETSGLALVSTPTKKAPAQMVLGSPQTGEKTTQTAVHTLCSAGSETSNEHSKEQDEDVQGKEKHQELSLGKGDEQPLATDALNKCSVKQDADQMGFGTAPEEHSTSEDAILTLHKMQEQEDTLETDEHGRIEAEECQNVEKIFGLVADQECFGTAPEEHSTSEDAILTLHTVHEQEDTEEQNPQEIGEHARKEAEECQNVEKTPGFAAGQESFGTAPEDHYFMSEDAILTLHKVHKQKDTEEQDPQEIDEHGKDQEEAEECQNVEKTPGLVADQECFGTAREEHSTSEDAILTLHTVHEQEDTEEQVPQEIDEHAKDQQEAEECQNVEKTPGFAAGQESFGTAPEDHYFMSEDANNLKLDEVREQDDMTEQETEERGDKEDDESQRSMSHDASFTDRGVDTKQDVQGQGKGNEELVGKGTVPKGRKAGAVVPRAPRGSTGGKDRLPGRPGGAAGCFSD
eukprot:g23644.t1